MACLSADLFARLGIALWFTVMKVLGNLANPVKLAARAKGLLALRNRAYMIMGRYGLTPTNMDQALARFVWTLKQFDCNATFPTTAVAVERHPTMFERYQAQGIEFAVHGYTHVDYSQLAPEE